MQNLITDHLDIWTSAHLTRSTVGRGSNNKLNLHGIKKLRELILELAVRGKLVPQDANDEPASELLKKIADENAKLIKEGKIKKEKPLPEITDEEKPFELPRGWEFVRLQNIIKISSGDGLIASNMNHEGGIPVFGGNGINGYHDQYNINKPTIVIGRVGYYCGSIHITPEKAWVTDNAFETIFSEQNIYILFLYWLLLGTNLKENENATAQPVISGAKVYPIIVGLPPLAEQHRIVAKVDELMAFCDQLEQTQSDNIAAHAHIVEALLATLIDSHNHFELRNNWQRIAAHFDTLFTTEHSIDQLKQTILQLAVMGKLVPQNPSDEPASELLKKIATEKAQLIKEGKIKRSKFSSEIDSIEHLYRIPKEWEWIKLGTICHSVSDGPHFSPRYVESDVGVPFISARNIRIDSIDIESAKYVSREDHEDFCKRVRVKKGDLLYTKGGTTGIAKVNDLDFEFSVWVHVAVLQIPNDKVFNEYLALALNCPHGFSQSQKLTHGIGNKDLGLTRMVHITIAMPPLAEQHRIVTKVGELITLCDTLKTNLQNAQTTQLALTDALVEQAVG